MLNKALEFVRVTRTNSAMSSACLYACCPADSLVSALTARSPMCARGSFATGYGYVKVLSSAPSADYVPVCRDFDPTYRSRHLMTNASAPTAQTASTAIKSSCSRLGVVPPVGGRLVGQFGPGVSVVVRLGVSVVVRLGVLVAAGVNIRVADGLSVSAGSGLWVSAGSGLPVTVEL